MSFLDLLSYQQSAVSNGEWYRLLTAHFIHLSPSHMFWNGMGFSLLALLFQHQNKTKKILPVALLSAMSISWFLWLCPVVTWYCGFSGVLFGLATYILCEESQSLRFGVFSGFSLLLVSYISDQLNHTVPVLHPAHALGAGCGLVCYLWLKVGQVKILKT